MLDFARDLMMFFAVIILIPLLVWLAVLGLKFVQTRLGIDLGLRGEWIGIPAESRANGRKLISRGSLVFALGLGLVTFLFSDGKSKNVPQYEAQPFAQPPARAVTQQKEEIEIPRSRPGDKGRYFLLAVEKDGEILSALHKRVGPDSVVYTMTQTHCPSMMMRELGASEISPRAIELRPTKWFRLLDGSSKSDLAYFICAILG